MVPTCESSPGAFPSLTSPLTDQFNLFVQQPQVADYYVAYDSIFGGTVGQLNISLGAGTATVTVKINGIAVDGLTNIAVAQARLKLSASGHNAFSPGDDITISISAAVNAQNLKATLAYTRP